MKVEPEYVKDIVNLYSNGIEQKEITERTGQSYATVRYWLKKKDLYDPNRRVHNTEAARRGLAPHNEANKVSKQEAEARLAQFLLDKGFSYIGGYTGKNSHFQVSCLTCGGTFTRTIDSHTRKQEHIRCPICAEKKRDAKQAEKEIRHQQWKQQQEEYRQKKLMREQERQRTIDKVHICKECGCLYTNRSYAQSIGVEPVFIQHVECCSKACVEKQKRKKQREHKTERSHIKRAKIHGCEWERGITLRKLIARDGLRCAICGKMCDKNDRSYGNGNGPLYPSIDHIIPISKGGGHTWENVQVAHLYCNTLKNDKVNEKYGNVS